MNAKLSSFSGVALLVPLVLGFGRMPTRPHTATRTATALPTRTQLRQDMRKLWSEHVLWTREYIIAAAADAPDLQVATNRLMKNQDDIGTAVGGYYGKQAGDHLTALLKQHIQIAADLINAAKAGDNDKVGEESRAWDDNADSIATLLSHANPRWPKATLMGLLKGHLSTTTDEVKARLAKNWDDDASAFDAVYDHILKLSDALADGIIKQFPGKFSA
jgi:hypothetical protein